MIMSLVLQGFGHKHDLDKFKLWADDGTRLVKEEEEDEQSSDLSPNNVHCQRISVRLIHKVATMLTALYP